MSTENAEGKSQRAAETSNEQSHPENLTTMAQSDSPGKRALSILFWAPPWCRHDPNKAFKYSLSLNILFGLAGMITVANIYYIHPILHVVAVDFGVSDEQSSIIPTLGQAGYATGLLLVAPLGDLVPRRPFVLGLMAMTATIWIGLCVTRSFAVFEGLTFVVSIMTVTPQIMLPLVADIAPVDRRATAVSIVTSGLLLGLLFARIMSGVVANFIDWRYVYWIAAGLQYLFVLILFFTLPDFPRMNKGLSYWRILWSIVTITYSSPVLVQACIIGFCLAAPFPAFWTTLTFLLSSPPYQYSTVVIGLFALIGISTMMLGPIVSRFVIDKYVPHLTVIGGSFVALIGAVVGTFTGSFTVAGPSIEAIFIDAGFQLTQIANRSAIYAIAPKARNRINTAYMISIFCGQLTGTAAANKLYAEGGWVLSGSINIAFVGFAIIISLVRGPWEPGWVGWKGGWSFRLKNSPEAKKDDEEAGRQGEQDMEQDGSDREIQDLEEKGSNDRTIRIPEAQDERSLDTRNKEKDIEAGMTA